MLISGREACAHLAEVGISRRRGMEVLVAGFAGAPHGVGSRQLWDRESVLELATRPVVLPVDFQDVFAEGVFLARRRVAVDAPREQEIESLARGWRDISPWTLLSLLDRVRRHGFVRFVATTHTFVALGADIVDVRVLGDPQLVLRDPGSWFDGLDRCRVTAGPGRSWVIREGYRENWAPPAWRRTTPSV
jgi:hypothetical protein